MKTKIKRHSRSVISVVLAVCMLISCMTVGLIATDAAKMQSEEVGATYYIWKSESGGSSSNQYTCVGTSPQTFSATTGKNYYIAVSTSATDISSGTVWLTGADVSGVSTSSVDTQGFDGKQAVRFSMASADTVKVSYSSGSKIKIEKGTSTSSCTTDHKMIVTGSQQLTNTSTWQNTWSGAGTRNQMTYNSAIGMYEIKYTNINASASASDYFRFRILDLTTKGDPDTSWETDKGFAQGSGAITDASNILQGTSTTTAGSDNTFQFSLKQKANITIYLDDSKLGTSTAIQVIVTPAVSTVTAGTQTGGTVKVNNDSSASNIAYGGSVTLTATAGDDYVFSQWEDNSNLTYANQNAATTTATVTGSTTVNAIFVPKSYTVSKGTGTGFTITAPSSAQTKPWGTSVTVTAKADSLYALDYLYYLNNNTGSEVKIGENATSAEITNGTMTRTLSSMPTNNITVYAKVHPKEANNIKYGVTSDSPAGSGYVSVGEYYNSATTMKHTIDSDTNVIEGTKVNFGARPAVGYKFVGWYTNAAGTGTAIDSAGQDYTVTSPSGNYYAKFEKDTYLNYTGGVKLLIYAGDQDDVYLWAYTSSAQISGVTTWPGKHVSDYTETVVINNKTYHVFTTTETKFDFILSLNGSNQDKTYSIDGEGAYIVEYVYCTDKTKTPSVTAYGSTHSGNRGYATTAYFPVKYYVTNPDKGASTVRSNMFGEAGKSITFYHSPSDTSNWKTSRTTTGFSSNITNSKTTDVSTSRTMPSTYSATPVFTATFVEKEYYKVNFSAGAGGTVTATAGGKTITSGTPVMEGTSVTITAKPKDGYAVSGWTASGSLTGTSTNASRTFTIGADTTAKVYFSASKGTPNTGTYFGWARAATDTNVYPGNWTNFSTTYVRDGHVWAYIDNVSAGYYYISAYGSEVTSSSGAQDKCEKQYYRTAKDKSGDAWCSTEFSSYVTNCGRSEWGSNDSPCWNGRCNYGHFQVSSAVKALIIDLGPDDGSGHAQTSKGDGNHKFVQNNYRIIPVFNTDISKVSVYAKDASYRNNGEYDYLPGIANTVITEDSNVTGRIEHSEFETAVATKGQNITVTTTIGDSYKTKYYVKGFSVNGVTPALYEWKSGGVYTMTYTIPADFDKDYLEITPIYYRKDLSTVQFYIENYDEAFQNTGWGNTLSIYPYYQNTSNKNNAFGGYPGQPVINYGGRRFIEIPTSYNSKTIQGVTLSNDYFDIVHRDYCREVDDHLQTYDYDDFYKIYKETSDGYEPNGKSTTTEKKAADQITFAFKYRTATNNFSDSSNTVAYSTTNKTVHAPYSSFTAEEKDTKFKNGWEPLLDYHDRPIDLFGKQLSSANQTKEPLLVVSDDYAITYAGRYATTWTVYCKVGTNYTKIAEIAPSALIVATQARLGTGTYPAVTDKTGYPSTKNHKLADYSDEYQALKEYADTPVQITYESAIRNQDGYEKHWSMTGGSSEVSKRSDGRWFYSYEGEIINADLRIEYKNPDDPDTAYVSDTFREGTNRGTVTGATVHFTNTANDDEGPYALTEFHDTADYDGDIVSNFNYYYKFAATDVSGYIFQGWYMERDGISTAVNPADIKNLAGKSQMTSNATFVARYIKNPAGHLTINHLMDDGSTGAGTTYIGVEKSTDGTTWTNVTGTVSDIFVREDMVSVTDTDVMAYNSGYTLRVTLKTVVDADTAFDRFSANDDAGDHSPNYFSSDVTTDGSMSTTSFEVPVDDLFAIVDGFPKQQFDTLTYFSHTTKRPELIINHSIDPTSDSMAEGTAYVQAEVLDASGNHLAWLNGSSATDYVQGQNLTLPYNYFNTEGYKLKVYLKTTMGGFTQFDKFSILGEDLGNHQTTSGQSVQINDDDSMRTKLAEITFPIADLFSNGEPLVTELPYLSKLIVPEYKYEIKYTYPKYTDKTVFASYTVKELFSPEDLSAYMSLTNNDLAFQTDAAKKTFACSKAPYEDNFQKILDWSKGSFGDRSYNASTYTLSLQVTIDAAEQQKLNVQFNLPYAAKNEANPYEPLVTDNKVAMTDPREIVSTKQTYGRDWFVIRGKRNSTVAEGEDPVFVKAPLIIYDGNTPYYFKYWTVQTEKTDNNASRVYTRCYDYEFNLAIFQDCIITPEYDTTPFANRGVWPSPPTSYNDYGRFDPDVNRAHYDLEGNGVSITFLENSRNQYNNGDGGANEVETRKGAADRIYSDFLLTFDNNPMVTLKDSKANTMQAGLIIQPVGTLKEDGKGGYTVEEDSYYEGNAEYAGATPAQIKAHLEGTSTSTIARLQRSKFDVTRLDNKNRIQYYFGIDNAAAKASNAAADEDGIIRVGNTYNNQKYVFKAFAYIGEGTADADKLSNVYVSQKPIYFTIYKDATIAPGYYMPATSGS